MEELKMLKGMERAFDKCREEGRIWKMCFLLIRDFIRLFPCGRRGICSRLGGSFTANILHLL